VLDIDCPGKEYPLFPVEDRWEADIQPGDVLFIPALWFHNMKAHDFGVAVNVFWKELDKKFYDPKDFYGNKELLPGSKALAMLDNVVKQLNLLPPVYRDAIFIAYILHITHMIIGCLPMSIRYRFEENN